MRKRCYWRTPDVKTLTAAAIRLLLASSLQEHNNSGFCQILPKKLTFFWFHELFKITL